jgi:hypothetical protein
MAINLFLPKNGKRFSPAKPTEEYTTHRPFSCA